MAARELRERPGRVAQRREVIVVSRAAFGGISGIVVRALRVMRDCAAMLTYATKAGDQKARDVS